MGKSMRKSVSMMELGLSFSVLLIFMMADSAAHPYNKEWKTFEEKSIVPNELITKVHIVSMNHLDVGFNHYLDDVLNLYFTKFFPRAINLILELRDQGYNESFIYTTHPWLVSLYIDCPGNINLISAKVKCPSAVDIDRFRSAVSRGDITWHAGPMNMQFEFMDQSLAEFAIGLSESLDQKFGVKREYRTMSQRDVPGLTHAVVPILASMGVAGLSVGVNAASSPPAVPRIFNWWYGNQSVIAMWHPGGYPDNPGPSPRKPGGLSRDDCLVVPGLSHTLCFAFRSDNQGPPESVEEILVQYDILRTEFPNAELTASTLENFLKVVYPLKSDLPNVTSEIGDTWIQGIQSDPRKVQEMKSFMRLRTKCINQGKCSISERGFYNSSRLLLKTAEHTWGRNGVTDTVNWTNLAFQQVRHSSGFKNSASSWQAQRGFTDLALDAVDETELGREVIDDWISTLAWKPDIRGYTRRDGRNFSCNNLLVKFTQDGYIQSLTDTQTKVTYNGDFGRLEYRTYNQSDFDVMDKEYTYKTWFRLGVEKPNMTVNAHPDSRVWETRLAGFYQRGKTCDFYTHLSMADSKANSYYGAPEDYWIHYTQHRGVEKGLDVEVQYFNKRATRLPEALFYSFRPAVNSATKWYYQKLGRLVDPDNVLVNGSKRLHGIDEHIYYYDAKQQSALDIVSRDVALVSTLTHSHNATVFPLPLNLQEHVSGSSFNFFNNVWNVNYVLWYPFLESRQDGDFLARFTVKIINTQTFNKIPKPEHSKQLKTPTIVSQPDHNTNIMDQNLRFSRRKSAFPQKL